jgi:putative transposase
MSNHFHIVLGLAPSQALGWSDEQVAERYGRLFRRTVEHARTLPPEAWAKKVSCWRRRLWDLSWFMRCTNESIARRANREDRCTGRFWEGRFRSQALLDEGALLTCISYVDLNPIRAGMTDTLEDSELTSIRERLLAAAGDRAQATWLAPFAGDTVQGRDAEVLPLTLADYVEVLRWSGAAVRDRQEHKPLPEGVAARLSGLGLDGGGFIEVLRNYARSFFTMVGHVHRIDVESRRRGYKRRPGVRAARRLYRMAAP